MTSLRVGAFFGFFSIIAVTLLQAEEYNVFSEPQSLDPWSLLDQDYPADQVEKLFTSICTNYHIIHDNEEIDCSNIRFRPKDPLVEDHVLRKREATDETEIEASGNGEDGKVVELSPEPSQHLDDDDLIVKEANVPEADVPEADVKVDTEEHVDNTLDEDTSLNDTKSVDKAVEEPKDDVTHAATPLPVIQLFETASSNATDNSEAQAVEEPVENKIEPPTTQKAEPVEKIPKSLPTEIKAEEPSVEAELPVAAVDSESSNTTVSSHEPEDKVEEPNVEAAVPEENNSAEEEPAILPSETSSVAPVVTPSIIDSATQDPTVLSSTALAVDENNAAEEESAIARSEISSQAPAVTNPAVADNTPVIVNEVTTIPAKEPEPIYEEQSGNAILLKEPKDHGKIEGSDTERVIDSIQSNAKETEEKTDKIVVEKTASILEDKNGTNTEPETAESSKAVSRAGGKDATLLISLFVVVLVIGAAAFAHNYIRKRKQRVQEASNGIKRNSIATNGKIDTDIEQGGTEMKPLMKNELVKEYSDSKKEIEA